MRATWLGELIGERCLTCGAGGSRLCRRCWSSLQPSNGGPVPPRVGKVAAAWAYEGPARGLILALKLRALRTAAVPLVAGMTAAARRQALAGTVLTWVPGRRSDIRLRGFDHAELLARGLARQLGLPARGLLHHRHGVLDQASLSARDRRLNVRGAFEAARTPRKVILVDDLLTTGATATACAAALQAAGAEQIDLVVASRA